MKDLTIKVGRPPWRNPPPITDRRGNWSAWVDGEGKTTSCPRATASDALSSPAERNDESTTHERKEQTHG
jgi:hypothetical protein